MKKSCCALLISSRNSKGFSLVELMVVGAIMIILGAVATQSYQGYIKKKEIQRAVDDIKSMEMLIKCHEQEVGSLPDSLDQVPGLNDMKDPWGNPYVYTPLSGSSKDNARKDRNLHPINTDYDLYSKGKDGKSTLPLTAKISQDDIIRANNGEFIGLASDY